MASKRLHCHPILPPLLLDTPLFYRLHSTVCSLLIALFVGVFLPVRAFHSEPEREPQVATSKRLSINPVRRAQTPCKPHYAGRDHSWIAHVRWKTHRFQLIIPLICYLRPYFSQVRSVFVCFCPLQGGVMKITSGKYSECIGVVVVVVVRLGLQ